MLTPAFRLGIQPSALDAEFLGCYGESSSWSLKEEEAGERSVEEREGNF